jgi:hypothetical protein
LIFNTPVVFCFFKRNYEVIRQQNGNNELSRMDIMSMIEIQWMEADEQEQQAWQFKSDQQLKQAAATAAAAASGATLKMEDAINRSGSPGRLAATSDCSCCVAIECESQKKSSSPNNRHLHRQLQMYSQHIALRR